MNSPNIYHLRMPNQGFSFFDTSGPERRALAVRLVTGCPINLAGHAGQQYPYSKVVNCEFSQGYVLNVALADAAR
jgi:hypothetical protein